MFDLDETSAYQQFDKLGMLGHLHSFPEQCRRAWEMVIKLDIPPEYSQISNVVIVGMGGSAIGGDIVRRLAQYESKVPVRVHRDYGLPAFVDESTLVIASSYSGNTEETLSAFTESLKTRAKKMVITSGGKLKQLAEKERVPVFVIDYRAPPRAAFPHSLIPLVGIFQKLGLLADKSVDLHEAVDILNQLSGDLAETRSLASNPAKQLAAKLWAGDSAEEQARKLEGLASWRRIEPPHIVAPKSLLPVEQIITYDRDMHERMFELGRSDAARRSAAVQPGEQAPAARL